MPNPELSVVFPTYNEEARLERALARTLEYVRQRGLQTEVLIVNDGSVDGTESVAREIAKQEQRVEVLSHTPNRGKGYAVRRGMLAARGEYRVFLDVDMATPVEEIDHVLPLLQAGADLVIGTRHHGDSVIVVRQGVVRRFMGWVFRRIAAAVLPLNVSDVTCGFKAVRAEVAEELFLAQQETGWAFDAELIHVARRWGLDLREVPVRWYDSGDTRVQPLANAWESLCELVRVRLRDRRGVYARTQPSDSP